MCMHLYLASDEPLEEILFKGSEGEIRPFSISTRVIDRVMTFLKKHFSKKHIYIGVSYEGCGCGFEYGRYSPEDISYSSPEDEKKSKESVEALSNYLKKATQMHGDIELYTFTDEEGEEKESKTITPDKIGGDKFWFEDKQLLTIVPNKSDK